MMSRKWMCVCCLMLSLAGCGQEEPITAGGKTAAQWAEKLHNKDFTARANAANKLGPLIPHDPAAFPALLTALRDPKPEVRLEAVNALGKYGSSKLDDVLPVLREAQQRDGDTRVSRAAAEAIRTLTAASSSPAG